MQPALIALIMAALEVIEVWVGWSPEGLDAKWIETLLMVLLPGFVWLAPPGGWTPWGRRG